ncbi:MAG: type Z 30S ribosomal protein S14 [bacterium]|nr:type Z 30S ribosomal protein S14 [bacterium]
MARKAKIVKQEKPKKLKYEVQYRNRCKICGRSRGYIRFVGLCRLCFRQLAHKGELPGIKKASW